MLTMRTRGSGDTQQSATTRYAQAPTLKEMRWRIAAGHVGLLRGQGGKEGGVQGKDARVGKGWQRAALLAKKAALALNQRSN
jgi:hypothetical protein